jgi:hypothetical protein
MKHVSQCELDEARDAIRGGASLEQVAGRLRVPEADLQMLLRGKTSGGRRTGLAEQVRTSHTAGDPIGSMPAAAVEGDHLSTVIGV